MQHKACLGTRHVLISSGKLDPSLDTSMLAALIKPNSCVTAAERWQHITLPCCAMS